jgi:hypothetical protein
MNEQYFNERLNTSASVESADQDTNSPVENTDPFAGQEASMVETPVHEIPAEETAGLVGPLEEVPFQEAPMGQILISKPQVDGTIAGETPLSESIPPYQAPMGETITNAAPVPTSAVSSSTLLNRDVSEHLRTRWNEIQGMFVDEPRAAVQQADELVSEVIEQITHMFASEHSALEGQWKQGNDVSTEDLRKALQRYRSFFNRLVV